MEIYVLIVLIVGIVYWSWSVADADSSKKLFIKLFFLLMFAFGGIFHAVQLAEPRAQNQEGEVVTNSDQHTTGPEARIDMLEAQLQKLSAQLDVFDALALLVQTQLTEPQTQNSEDRSCVEQEE